MATITIDTIPYKVVAADTTDNVLDITHPHTFGGMSVYTIEVTLGSFQFATSKVVGANNPTYNAGDKLVLSANDQMKINFKAGSASDEFIISK